MRFGHNIPEDSALHLAALRYARQVESATGGKVRVSVYPAQQLGNDHQMVEMARAGELDILLTPTAKMSVPVPAMQYADLPFYFPTRDDLYTMLDGEPGRMLLGRLKAIGLVGVTFWENGFKHFTANRPLHGPADFKGLKIRTMKSRILMDQFRHFGAQPIPIDFHATRKALADGVVDGQENPLVAIVSMGFHQVQSDLTLSNHGYLGYVLSISAKVFEQLPQDIRAVLVQTGRELTPWERAETHRRERSLLEQIRAAGVRVHELSAEDRQGFAELTKDIPGRFEAVIGTDLLSRTEELLWEKYAPPAGETVVLGLDADLSMDARDSGLAIKRGAQLAIDEINAAGGVLGRPMKLLALDHGGQPSRGQANIERLARMPDVVAVLGGQHSPVISAELEQLHRLRLPLLAPWSSGTGVVENGYQPNYVFRVSANDRLVGPFLAEWLLRRYRRPAILMENSFWGRSGLKSLEPALAGQLAAVESFNRGETNLDVHLDRIYQAGADVILAIAKPLEGGLLAQSLARRSDRLPLLSHWGITGGAFWSDNREALKKLRLEFFQTLVFQDNARPRTRALATKFMQHYDVASPGLIPAPVGVAQAYDLVHLLARAVELAGSTERPAIRDALERLGPYRGAVRDYQAPFSPTRHDALDRQDYHIARYAPNGAIVLATEIGSGRSH